jgi:hypothetical protein
MTAKRAGDKIHPRKKGHAVESIAEISGRAPDASFKVPDAKKAHNATRSNFFVPHGDGLALLTATSAKEPGADFQTPRIQDQLPCPAQDSG